MIFSTAKLTGDKRQTNIVNKKMKNSWRYISNQMFDKA